MLFTTIDSQAVMGFHHGQIQRAHGHGVAIVQLAESNPSGLAALLRANPRVVAHLGGDVAEAVAKAMAEQGYSEVCDVVAHDPGVARDVRAAFKSRGEVDYL